jgi:nitrate/nitrite transporter NarK
MVNNTITTYSPEFLDRESLFSVYSLACLANFASPYTLAYPQQGNGSCRITALGRHAGLARGLLFNASVYLTISLGKGSVWQESGQGENRALNFSTPLSKATFAGLFTMQQIVLAGYTAAGMYAFPSEAVPRHQSAEALGKVASMGKIGAIIGALVMPLLREKQGFESVMASCSASLFAASVISQLGLPVYNEEQVVKVQDNPDKLYSTLYGG